MVDIGAAALHDRAIMTPDTILQRVRDLATLERRDCEAAAAGAEELRCEVLAAIAEGAPDAVVLAKAAMRTIEQDIGGQ